MTDQNGHNIIHDVITDIFRRYAPQAPENALKKIESKCGIVLNNVTLENSNEFLGAMQEELAGVMEEWKAKFVTGVIRQMVARSIKKEE
ncbi:MAG: hypothetical protein KJ620_05930 [Candidatus Edwardsbacteria bacterium]|nr:hypothetical protein [Candidatus Edwardsbacteria bacterium]MBU1575863.1 hypothetical protein [Candidatus Edwardsbacteria bacterium]MBU2463649.1 hypothetical protein [Candidatus Edwardsbacteria bacterium]MBU2593077.1 hypothetical protein [Candidatus Edwardsbacteria bacterium]